VTPPCRHCSTPFAPGDASSGPTRSGTQPHPRSADARRLEVIGTRWLQRSPTSVGGTQSPLHHPRGEALFLPCHSIFVALVGAELSLGTGTTTALLPPVPSDEIFLSLKFVQNLAAELAVNEVFGPIVRGAKAAPGNLVDRLGKPIVGPARSQKGGKFLVCCCLRNPDFFFSNLSHPFLEFFSNLNPRRFGR
jgi:hypothetical protein